MNAHKSSICINLASSVNGFPMARGITAFTVLYQLFDASTPAWSKDLYLMINYQGSQEQKVKFQGQLFSKFQDIFVVFTRLKT